MPLRPGDRAFVIANLDFDAAGTDNGGTVWPPESLGFDHDLSAEEFAEFQAAAAALLRRHGGPVRGARRGAAARESTGQGSGGTDRFQQAAALPRHRSVKLRIARARPKSR
jgi:hypothetical protein